MRKMALVAAAAVPIGAAYSMPSSEPVQFSRDIRPLLSDNCFACHGPDHNKRQAGLRMDIPDASLRRVVMPGRPNRSELIARIFASQDSLRMPPPSTHKKLTPAQKDLLKRWVAEGAKYEKHWSLVPVLASVPIPSVSNPKWCRNEIDRFVLARLDREHLRPSPEADRATWLRRVALDVTGIPPTIQEVDAFLSDRSNAAYDTVVDRLLASPRFGERMATPWLDAARYADSYGYQSDQLCPTWPYRDWVVSAFNRNLPYDQFITWQIAGDLLPNATREQRLATAFNRLHRMTNEGGSVPEEWRMEGVADRVRTFGTAILGFTTECARCHDHKFDPVSQRDYYALSAFFNSIDEYGLYDRADIVPTPSLLLPTPEQEKELHSARDAAVASEQALAKARVDRNTAFRAWIAAAAGAPDSNPVLAGSRPADERGAPTHGRGPSAVGTSGPDSVAIRNPQSAIHEPDILPDLIGRFDFERFDGTKLANLVPGAKSDGERQDDVPLVDGHRGKAVQFDGENNVHFNDLGRFDRNMPWTIGFWMRDPRLTDGPTVVFQACDGTDTGPHGYDLTIDHGILTARLFRHWPGNAIAVRAKAEVPKDAWTHVAVTYDGSSRAAGLHIYLNGKPAELESVRDRLYKGIGLHTLVFGQRFRDRGFKGGRIDDLMIFSRAISPIEAAQAADGTSLTNALANPSHHEAELADYYFSALDPEARQAAAKLTAARQRIVATEDAQFEIPVMEEMPQPRPAYVLKRGAYDAPKTDENRVGRDTPAAILPFPPNLSRNRLGLAQWLTRPDHPLTSRVAVNRFWAMLFGRGIVETQEDFGVQGRLPTHPELLDWLARRFMTDDERPKTNSGPGSSFVLRRSSAWDVKRLIRLIVLSSTYRQSSSLRPDLAERDPANLLLARGPSHRLSAEQIRDTALAASGLLDERIGGPPVSPYQPGDLWRESNSMSPAYHQSVGTDLYRRSLYTVWKRTAPMPNMVAFDEPSREVCTARRTPTNTPLQALVLLNDPQFVEAARVIGQRMIKQGGSNDAARIRCAFRLLATREPTAQESSLLAGLYARQREKLARAPEEAKGIVTVGESKPDPTIPVNDLAAATVVAQTILNLDATVWNR